MTPLILLVEIFLFSFAMPGPRKERRKKNFSQDERAIVVSAMERYDSRLHGADSGSTSKTKKEEILKADLPRLNRFFFWQIKMCISTAVLNLRIPFSSAPPLFFLP